MCCNAQNVSNLVHLLPTSLILSLEYPSLLGRRDDFVNGQICPTNTASGSGGTSPTQTLTSTGTAIASSGAIGSGKEGTEDKNLRLVVTSIVMMVFCNLAWLA